MRKKPSRESGLDDLPDEILLSIISLLPFKEAVRTSVLAHRWSGLWSFVSHVDLDTGVIIKQCKQCHNEVEKFKTPPSSHLVSHLISSLDKIVSTLKSAITCCRITFPDFIHHHNELTDWVKSLVNRRRIQELTLVWKPKARYAYNRVKLALPPGMFSGGTLRILRLTNFELLSASDLDGCTNITTLKLNSVCLTDDVVDEIIKWESLEKLSISTVNCTITDLKIRGQKLKYLRLKGFNVVNIDIRVSNLNVLMLEEIFCSCNAMEIDTPNLTFFHADSVDSLEDLNIGQFIHGWKLLENLRLSNCSRIRALKIYHHNLKILELEGLKSFVFEVQAEKLSALALKNVQCRNNLIVLDTPNLEAFHVRNVRNFSNENFDQIIRVSKFLKDVVLHYCPKVTKVNIDHQNLEILQLQELTLNKLKMRVEKLHVLEIGNVSCPIKDMVIKAPNLINLQLYNTSEKNQINLLSPVDLLENQTSIVESEPGKFDQLGSDHMWCHLRLEILHTLSISLNLNITRDINILSSVLKFCTRLEALNIVIQESNARSGWTVNGDCMFWNDERMSTSKGIDYNCLKTVELHGYRNKALEFEFYKHLMQKAKNLEK